jgi:TolB-like protein/Tfp pilus assembly protein PilF
MKRCPECGRDYNDDSLSFCLDDGAELLFGPGSTDEPATAIMSASDVPPLRGTGSESITRPQIHQLVETPERLEDAIERQSVSSNPAVESPESARGSSKRLLLVLLIAGVVMVGGFFGYRYVGSNDKQINSIAVMPFANESGNPELEYLSDGMTETLISSLSKIADLSVKARSAVFLYKGKDLSPKQIGDELGVQAVLLGRLVERGGNIRLNLELVNPKTLDVIWSEQYDRTQAELVNLQSDIARDVSSKLRSRLSGEDQVAVNKSYTNDPEVYRLYLQARFYLNKRVGKEFEMAEQYLRQAITRDPNFALGYVGLAEFLSQRDRPKAKEYILRALAIDNQLSDAHAALGLQLMLDLDFAGSGRELTRAIELDPINSRAHQWSGSRLMMIGRYDESLAAYDRAIGIEPTLADIRNNRGACLVAAGRVEEGIREIKRAIEMDPVYPWSYSHISFVYRMKGDHAASVDARARSVELLGRTEIAARLHKAFADGSWTGYLHELLAQTEGNFSSRTRRASILSELGRKEEAFASLDEAVALGDWWLFSIKYDPAFDPMRSDPRFQALVKKFEPSQ